MKAAIRLQKAASIFLSTLISHTGWGNPADRWSTWFKNKPKHLTNENVFHSKHLRAPVTQHPCSRLYAEFTCPACESLSALHQAECQTYSSTTGHLTSVAHRNTSPNHIPGIKTYSNWSLQITLFGPSKWTAFCFKPEMIVHVIPFIFTQLTFSPLKTGFLVLWCLVRSNSIFLTRTRDAQMQPKGLPALCLGCLGSWCQQQSAPAASKADGQLSLLTSTA